MSLPALSRLRESLAGCEVALLIDLPTRTCLLSAGALQTSQDQLERLCTEGAYFLQLEGVTGFGACILSGPLGIKVFARAAADQPEALCLLFGPHPLPEDLDARVRGFLRDESFMGRHV
ncbi:MAG: hypothetical protein AAFM92_10255 [Pseudomonadota bacterium]